MSLQIQQFTFNPFQENSFIIWDEDKNALIFDPGCYDRQEETILKNFIEENGLIPIALLNTHAHIDHVLGNAFVVRQFSVPFYLHQVEVETLQAVDSYAHVYGFANYITSPHPDKFVEHGQVIHLGKMEIEVRFCPGHSRGHVVYYFKNEGFVVNGDVVFKGSFGRTDLPGGDMATLKQSIHEQIFTLPEETVIYCGHGPDTTVGIEKKTNYILNF